jgi:hypothetical protein
VLLFLYVGSFIILPIAIVLLVLTSLFVLYYVYGLIMFCINKSKLNGHLITEQMLYYTQAPRFVGSNEYFDVTMIVQYLISLGQLEKVQLIKATQKTNFMAYNDSFLDDYSAMMSCKMIIIHIGMIAFPILGLIVVTRQQYS